MPAAGTITTVPRLGEKNARKERGHPRRLSPKVMGILTLVSDFYFELVSFGLGLICHSIHLSWRQNVREYSPEFTPRQITEMTGVGVILHVIQRKLPDQCCRTAIEERADNRVSVRIIVGHDLRKGILEEVTNRKPLADMQVTH